MSELVSLERAKEHLRVSDDCDEELITLYINATAAYITGFLNRPIPNITDSPSTPPPADIEAAALLLIGDLYENREAQVVTKSSSVAIAENPRVKDLLYPHRCDIGI